jgi:hypothetical protein
LGCGEIEPNSVGAAFGRGCGEVARAGRDTQDPRAAAHVRRIEERVHRLGRHVRQALVIGRSDARIVPASLPKLAERLRPRGHLASFVNSA